MINRIKDNHVNHVILSEEKEVGESSSIRLLQYGGTSQGFETNESDKMKITLNKKMHTIVCRASATHEV